MWPKDTKDQEELFEFYGEPGENQTRIALPFKMKLSWSLKQEISRFSCHEKVHDSLGRIYQKVLEIYGHAEIERLRLNVWGGCLNVRPKRGGSTYSLHAFGAAIDTDPENNKLRWDASRAAMAQPEYEDYWRAWEEEGWVSLGREKDRDWMHVQAARI
ncbi:MAG: M15 family metallopeptidase [Deltaproteobacteria bacterium]|jgi:hypothetical protein|nr:M15 family metallopeptidase [Deltaproteobacteria bacterium]